MAPKCTLNLEFGAGVASASRRGKGRWVEERRSAKSRVTCAQSHVQEVASFFKDRIPLEVCHEIEMVEK